MIISVIVSLAYRISVAAQSFIPRLPNAPFNKDDLMIGLV
jgi:hypothetical protein